MFCAAAATVATAPLYDPDVWWVAAAGRELGTIVAYRVADCFDVGNSIAVLVEAAKRVVGVSDAGGSPMLVVDGGVENFNGDVEKLIKSGVLRRVLAMTEIEFSNSLIEAFGRCRARTVRGCPPVRTGISRRRPETRSNAGSAPGRRRPPARC